MSHSVLSLDNAEQVLAEITVRNNSTSIDYASNVLGKNLEQLKTDKEKKEFSLISKIHEIIAFL